MMSSIDPPTDRRPMTRDEIRDQWAAVAMDWGRWEPYFASSTWPVTHRLITGLKLAPGHRVFDVGCGIGDLSLRLGAAVAPAGSVLAIDPAREMVQIAQLRARALSLDSIEFRADALEELDEPAGSFDGAAVQFTIMFLTDIAAGLERLSELLRPGGRIVVSTWAPMSENPMFSIPKAQLAASGELPRHAVVGPSPMRLSEPGELAAALEAAGFVDVAVADVRFYNFAKSPEEYFELLYALTPMFRRTFDALERDQQSRVRSGVMAAARQYADPVGIRVPGMARVGIGVRPGA
jgi:2-polyprenyl-3-methyl-5-hydroxy-6-metoxy-1,4-benzoquinol methylase